MPDNRSFDDDDLMVNDGESFQNGIYYPRDPEERIADEAAEKAPIALSYPIMDKLADWWREQIEHCADISNIQITSLTINGVRYRREVSIEAQVLAYQLLKELLVSKAADFDGFGKEVEDE